MATLKVGNSGGDVTNVQKMLNLLGYQIKIDGLFGSGTRTAVTAFQTRAGVTANGIIDERTLKAITDRIAQALPSISGQQLIDTTWSLFKARDTTISQVLTQQASQTQPTQVAEQTFMFKAMKVLNTEVYMGVRVAHVLGLGVAMLALYGLTASRLRDKRA